MTKKAAGILTCFRNSMLSRTRDVIILLYVTLMRLHFKHCVQFGAPNYKDIELLKHLYRKATKLVKGLKNRTCEE